jgi:polyketide biosynthesis enoyl-CoA hydratase PksI
MSRKVQLERAVEGVYVVRIDDPANQNRLSTALVDELMTALADLAADPTLRAAVLAGREDVFCGGGTLEMLLSVSEKSEIARDLLLPAQLIDFPVPLIGALEGHAVGAGLGLSLCCDVLVASETSRYSANFTSMGFTPGVGVTAMLPALVGYGFASEMMMSAKFYKGAELKGRGLFTHIVPSGEVMGLALDIASRIAQQPRHVLQLLKAELARPRRQLLTGAMTREHEMHEACFSRAETRELIQSAYVSSRPAMSTQLPSDVEERGHVRSVRRVA